MKLLFILLLTISLVFTQSATDPTLACKEPCYGSNVSPCANPDAICGKSVSAAVKPGCEYTCYPPGATDADKTKLSDSCAACTVKSTCSTGQQCVYKDTAKCYNCDCQRVNCLADPCGAANECAKKLGASCVSNYCGGCNAEYYLNGRRVCTNTSVTCQPCAKACPTGTIQKYTDDGCEVCDSCTAVCPLAQCNMNCPNGFEVDANGCQKCQCRPCPAVLCAANCVNGYYVDPYTKCQTCTCNNCTTCNNFDVASCQYGYEIDPKTGCKTCRCATCQAVDCSTVKCANGFLLEANGCPSCKCKPDCLRYCPDGYKYDATGAQTCDCACSPINCLLACANYAVDANGCKTCSCIKPYDTCTKPACQTPCDYGYVTENGCLTCKCEPKPVCPALLCAVKCAYGVLYEKGCPTCSCEPCPPVTCPRYCPYGFVKRLTTGCPECVCAQKDICPYGGVSGDSKTSPTICPLSCTNGYELDSNGCPSCKCLPSPKCTCTVRSTEQIKCADGNTYDKYIDVCRADASNVCSYVERKCPIAVEIKLASGVSLTEAEIDKIVADVKTTVSIPDADVKYVTKTNPDGTKSIVVFVNTDTVPINKTPTDVKDQTSASFKTTGKQGEAFLIESNAQTSFGTMLLVPILGFIAMLL